jgi:hypothetical protein
MIAWLVASLEVLGGSRPARFTTPARSVALGVWWITLFLLTLAFAGRFTKFVYVDF